MDNGQTIFRSRLTQNFTTLPNDFLRDSRLSFKARGLAAMVLTNSEDWVVTKEWATEQGQEGREAVNSAFKELQDLGYLTLEKKTESGRFVYLWTFYDTPGHGAPPAAPGNPLAGNRERETASGNPAASIKTITEEQSKKGEGAAAPDPAPPQSTAPKAQAAREPVASALPPEALYWNANCGALPKVAAWNPSRQRHLEARRRDKFWADNFKGVVLLVVKSDFLTGKNDRGWRADFMWLVERPDALAKVMEGKYRNKAAAPVRRSYASANANL